MKELLLNVDPVFGAFIATTFTFLLTTIGSSLVFIFKNINKHIMDALLGFAAGVMIAASFWSLLNPAIDMAITLDMIPWLVTFLGFISGGLFLFLGDKLFNKVFYFKEMKKEKKYSFKRCVMLIFSITLHNIPEGLAIGVAFGSAVHGNVEATILSAYLLALGIGLQNLPEGSAVSLPLRREGFSLKKSFALGSLSGIVEPIAGVIGALLVMKIKTFLPFLLSFAAGAMIYVVVCELIPESQKNKNKDLITFFTLVGFSLMMILDVALG